MSDREHSRPKVVPLMSDDELQFRLASPNLSPGELRSLLRIVKEKHAEYPPGKVGWSSELETLEHRLEQARAAWAGRTAGTERREP